MKALQVMTRVASLTAALAFHKPVVLSLRKLRKETRVEREAQLPQ